MKGNITRKITSRAFGFILGEDGKDYFFHMSELLYCSWDNIEEGDSVTFNIFNRNGKEAACSVEKSYINLGDDFEGNPNEKTYAGIHPMVKLTSFSDEERKIIKTLGDIFM